MEEIRICGPPNGLPLRPGSWDGCTLRWEGLLLLLLLLVLVPKLPKNDGQELSCLGWYLFLPCFCERFATFPKVQGHQSENLYTNDSRTQIGRHLHSLPKSCFGRLPTTFAVFFFFVSECHPFVSEFSVRGGLRNNSLGLTIHGILKPFFKKTIDSFPKTLVHSNEVEAQK